MFSRSEEPTSWIALFNIQTNPTNADFLRQVTDGLQPLIAHEQPGILGIGGFIFVPAPPSVPPFRIDRENNLWLQTHGREIMNVWDYRDRQVVAQHDVEKFIVYSGLENVQLRDGYS